MGEWDHLFPGSNTQQTQPSFELANTNYTGEWDHLFPSDTPEPDFSVESSFSFDYPESAPAQQPLNLQYESTPTSRISPVDLALSQGALEDFIGYAPGQISQSGIAPSIPVTRETALEKERQNLLTATQGAAQNMGVLGSALMGAATPNDQEDMLDAMVRGIKEARRGTDVIEYWGAIPPQDKDWAWHEILTSTSSPVYDFMYNLGGLGLDFAWDPTTYYAPGGKAATKVVNPVVDNLMASVAKVPLVETAFKPVAQLFSRKAFRGPNYAYADDALSAKLSGAVVEESESATAGTIFDKTVKAVALEKNIPIDEANEFVYNAFKARQQTSAANLQQVGPHLLGDFENGLEYLEEHYLPKLGRQRTQLEAQRLADMQTALMETKYRVPNEALSYMAQFKYPFPSHAGMVPADNFMPVVLSGGDYAFNPTTGTWRGMVSKTAQANDAAFRVGVKNTYTGPLVVNNRPVDIVDLRAQGFDSVSLGNGQVEFLYPPQRYQQVAKNKFAKTVLTQDILNGLYKPQIADELADLALAADDMDLARRATSLKRGFIEPENDFGLLQDLTDGMTPEATRFMYKKLRDTVGFGGWSPAHAKELFDTFDQALTIFDANKFSKAGNAAKASPLFDGFKGKIFEDEPGVLSAIRDSRVLRERAQIDVTIDAAMNIGKHKSTAPPGWEALNISTSKDGRYAFAQAATQDLVFDKESKKLLDSMFQQSFVKGTDWNMVRKGAEFYKEIISNFKGIVLNFSPSYFFRNFLGAQNNMMVGNAWNPADQRMANRILRGAEKGTVEVGGRQITAKKLNRMRRLFGIGGGFVTAEAGREFMNKSIPYLYRMGQGQSDNQITKQILRPLRAAGRGVSKVANKSYKMSQALESNMRFGQWITEMNNGKSPLQAAVATKLAQGDYLFGLTDFERVVMRTAFPFWTFSRYNVPFQVKGLVRNPRAFIGINKIMGAFEDEEAKGRISENEELIKRYMPFLADAGLVLPLDIDKQGRVIVSTYAGALTIADLEIVFGLTGDRGPKTALTRAIQSLNPIADAAGIDEKLLTYFNEPLPAYEKATDFSGQKAVFFGEEMNAKVVDILKIIRPLADMDRIAKAWYDGELNREDGKKVDTVIRFLHGIPTTKINLPALRRLRKAEISELEKELHQAMRGGEKENAQTLRNLIRDLKQLR